jgi:hypothetical protein
MQPATIAANRPNSPVKKTSGTDLPEIASLRRLALLRASYGWRWKWHAPPELAWMLRTGVSMGDAVAHARMLATGTETGSRHLPGRCRRCDTRNGHVGKHPDRHERTCCQTQSRACADPREAAVRICRPWPGAPRVRHRPGRPGRFACQGLQAAGRPAGHERRGPRARTGLQPASRSAAEAAGRESHVTGLTALRGARRQLPRGSTPAACELPASYAAPFRAWMPTSVRDHAPPSGGAFLGAVPRSTRATCSSCCTSPR